MLAGRGFAMPTNAAQLETIKTQTLARIAEITASPKPSYNIDGQDIRWGDYLRQLRGTIDWANGQLAGETIVEVTSRGHG